MTNKIKSMRKHGEIEIGCTGLQTKEKNGEVLICENANVREINKINHLELLKIYVLQTKLYGK